MYRSLVQRQMIGIGDNGIGELIAGMESSHSLAMREDLDETLSGRGMDETGGPILPGASGMARPRARDGTREISEGLSVSPRTMVVIYKLDYRLKLIIRIILRNFIHFVKDNFVSFL